MKSCLGNYDNCKESCKGCPNIALCIHTYTEADIAKRVSEIYPAHQILVDNIIQSIHRLP